jgi:hypothetical protein
MFKKLREEGPGLVWTLAGTGLVLITLSGKTFSQAVTISAVAFGVYLLAVFASPDSD